MGRRGGRAARLGAKALARLTPQAAAQFLAQTAIFQGCPEELLQKLAPHVEQESHAAGAMLLPAGKLPTTLTFLVSGRGTLQIIDVRTGNRSVVEDIVPGDTYSEIAMALGSAAPVVAVALEDCEVLAIQRAHFDKLVIVHPPLSQILAKRVAARFVKLSMLRAAKEGEDLSLPKSTQASEPAPAPGARDPNQIMFVQIAQFSPNPKVLEMVPSRMVQEHRLLPLELRGRTLTVGMVNPLSIAAREELRKVLHGVDPDIVAIAQDDFTQALTRFKLDAREPTAAGGVVSRALRPKYYAELKKEADKSLGIIGDDAVVLLDQILLEGLEKGASDITIEPEVSSVRVRYRIQGLNSERKELIPSNFATPLIARIKVLAELDITDRRTPQDGRIVAQLGRRELNLRVGTLPTARGEKAVIRLLDPADVMRPLEQIVLDSRALELVKSALSIPQGAFIVSGPSGSGKTSTLYALINQRKLHKSLIDIITAEDPVEFLLPGVTQTPVHSRSGLGYPQVVRAMMRTHPEVVVIGELVDSETAQLMGEASLTGTQVLTTIHAGSVAAAIQRLLQFKLDPIMIAQSLSIVVAQKLVRRLCSTCVRDEEVAPELVQSLRARDLIPRAGTTKLPRAIGCDACAGTGFFGRMPVVEVFAFDPELRMMTASAHAIAEILQRASVSGRFISFAHSARLLMARRILAPADALAVTG